MSLQDKLNKAKKIAVTEGKDFSQLSAFKIAAEMDKLGYIWDGKVLSWVKVEDSLDDAEVKTIKINITGHPLVLPEFLELFNEFLANPKNENFVVENRKPYIYPITIRQDKKLAGMGFQGAAYQVIIKDSPLKEEKA